MVRHFFIIILLLCEFLPISMMAQKRLTLEDLNFGGVNYAAQFAGSEEDDEPFDFDSFMNEHAAEQAQQSFLPQEAPPEEAPPEEEALPGQQSFLPMEEEEPQPEPAPPQPAPAPHIPAQPKKTAAPGGSVDKALWLNVVRSTERSFLPLIGKLTGSVARVLEGVLVVKLADPKIRMMMDEAVAAEKLQPFVKQYLGETYNIKFEY